MTAVNANVFSRTIITDLRGRAECPQESLGHIVKRGHSNLPDTLGEIHRLRIQYYLLPDQNAFYDFIFDIARAARRDDLKDAFHSIPVCADDFSARIRNKGFYNSYDEWKKALDNPELKKSLGLPDSTSIEDVFASLFLLVENTYKVTPDEKVEIQLPFYRKTLGLPKEFSDEELLILLLKLEKEMIEELRKQGRHVEKGMISLNYLWWGVRFLVGDSLARKAQSDHRWLHAYSYVPKCVHDQIAFPIHLKPLLRQTLGLDGNASDENIYRTASEKVKVTKRRTDIAVDKKDTRYISELGQDDNFFSPEFFYLCRKYKINPKYVSAFLNFDSNKAVESTFK